MGRRGAIQAGQIADVNRSPDPDLRRAGRLQDRRTEQVAPRLGRAQPGFGLSDPDSRLIDGAICAHLVSPHLLGAAQRLLGSVQLHARLRHLPIGLDLGLRQPHLLGGWQGRQYRKDGLAAARGSRSRRHGDFPAEKSRPRHDAGFDRRRDKP